ncbi:hypothetical protein C8F01DRAFT_1224563 [Mycena amicta]|nr:hypothetical protein C8F01DRAFT_1224563 [Mycena amicta]
MPSSPYSTPIRLGNLLDAMNQETPTSPVRTSPGPTSSSPSSIGPRRLFPPDDEQGLSLPAASQNAKAAVQRYALSKHMHPDQTTEALSRLQDSPSVQHAKLYIDIEFFENKVNLIVAAQPVFETNIVKYAVATLLSPKLVAYKGSSLVNTIMDIILKHRFDLPVGIENNPADLETLKRTIQEALMMNGEKVGDRD